MMIATKFLTKTKKKSWRWSRPGFWRQRRSWSSADHQRGARGDGQGKYWQHQHIGISFIIMLSKVMPSLNNLLLATQHYIDMNTNNSVKIIMNVFSKVPDMVNRMTGVDVTNVRTIHEKYLWTNQFLKNYLRNICDNILDFWTHWYFQSKLKSNKKLVNSKHKEMASKWKLFKILEAYITLTPGIKELCTITFSVWLSFEL